MMGEEERRKDKFFTPLPVSFHFICFVTCPPRSSGCSSAKVQMDRLLVLVLVLVLMPAVVAGDPAKHNNSTANNFTNISTVATSTVTERKNTRIPITIIKHIPDKVKMKWEKTTPCQGTVYYQRFTERSMPLCLNSFTMKLNFGKEMCEERRCGKFQGFQYFPGEGYTIHKNLTLTTGLCEKIQINCEENKELVAYRAVTGVLVTLILVVVLLQFGRPTFQALRKRFSPKPHERWIGPTQSQSVSYHRGQGGSNNNTAKRQSFPGLERLTVSSSREPSSNRNSDYESYGC